MSPPGPGPSIEDLMDDPRFLGLKDQNGNPDRASQRQLLGGMEPRFNNFSDEQLGNLLQARANAKGMFAGTSDVSPVQKFLTSAGQAFQAANPVTGHPGEALLHMIGGPDPTTGETTADWARSLPGVSTYENLRQGRIAEELGSWMPTLALSLLSGGIVRAPEIAEAATPPKFSLPGFSLPKAGVPSGYPPLPGIAKFALGKIPYIGKPLVLGYDYLRSQQPGMKPIESAGEPIPMDITGTLPRGLSYEKATVQPGAPSRVPGPSMSPQAPIVQAGPQPLAPWGGGTGELVTSPTLPQAGVPPLAPFGGATGDVSYPPPATAAAQTSPLAPFGGATGDVVHPLPAATGAPAAQAAPFGSTGVRTYPLPSAPAAAPTPQAATFGTTGTAGGPIPEYTSGTALGAIRGGAATMAGEIKDFGSEMDGLHAAVERVPGENQFARGGSKASGVNEKAPGYTGGMIKALGIDPLSDVAPRQLRALRDALYAKKQLLTTDEARAAIQNIK